FRREGRAIARLDHPNIVRVFDCDEHHGRLYLVMEFLEGGSLKERLEDGPLAPAAAAELIASLAEAMQHAHERGVVHRDLKPGNVLFTPAGVAKVADFGLAKRLDSDSLAQTVTGTILGTAAYMAPEQAVGKVREIGPPTDVYALGAILYECLI